MTRQHVVLAGDSEALWAGQAACRDPRALAPEVVFAHLLTERRAAFDRALARLLQTYTEAEVRRALAADPGSARRALAYAAPHVDPGYVEREAFEAVRADLRLGLWWALPLAPEAEVAPEPVVDDEIPDDLARAVLAALADGPLGRTAICERTRLPALVYDRAVRHLHAAGLVEPERWKRWALTEAGRERLGP